MIVPPCTGFIASGGTSSDDETTSNHAPPSTAGAAVDDKQNRESLIRSFNENLYDSMGHYAIPLINNKMTPLIKTTSSDSVLGVWVESWNSTMRQLSPASQQILKASRQWPDNGFGGPRAVKQLFEVLVLKRYVAILFKIKVEESRALYEQVKMRLSELCLKSTIDAHEEDTDGVHRQLKELSLKYKEMANDENIALRTARIIDVFKRVTIDSNTIKKKEDQELVHSFIHDPTIRSYEKVLQLFLPRWKSYLDEQNAEFERVKSGYGEAAVVLSEAYQPAKRRKTSDIRNTTDSEKAAIRHQCGHRCRGLPEGLIVRCNAPGVLQDWELEVDHSIPLRLLETDEDHGNKKCLCGRCHNFKTRFIDPVLTKHVEDVELLSMYKERNSLPGWATNAINLSVTVRAHGDAAPRAAPEREEPLKRKREEVEAAVDVESNGTANEPSKKAVDTGSSFYRRPPGRSPKNKEWDGTKGIWVEVGWQDN